MASHNYKGFVVIKRIRGQPRTGGEYAALEIYNSVKDVPCLKARLICSYPQESTKSQNIFIKAISVFYEMVFETVKTNLMTLKLVRDGYDVYADNKAGTFIYVQPPPSLTPLQNVVSGKSLLFFLAQKFLIPLDYLSRVEEII